MTIERTQVLWLESRSDYSIHELVELSGLPLPLLDDLVDCGALPATDSRPTRSFEAETIVLARAAESLRRHFELDEHGLAVAVSLLRRVRALELQLADARARSTRGAD